MSTRIAVVVGMAAMVVGCTPKPVLIRHYASMDAKGMKAPDLELSVFAMPPKPSPSSFLIAGLSDRGQAELIRSLSSKLPPSAKASELLPLLAESYESPGKSCAWAIHTSVQRRLAITLLGDLSKPADRVDRLKVMLTLPKNKVRFATWDRFDSAYGSINLGTAVFTQTDKVSIGHDATGTRNLPQSAGSEVTLFKLGAESTDQLQETMNYAVRRLTIGGALSDRVATIVQEGGPYLNLLGTSTATLTLALEPRPDSPPLYRLGLVSDGKPNKPASVTIERCESQFPARTEIDATVEGDAMVRLVGNGDGTISEGDDSIEMKKISFDNKNKIKLLSKDDAKVQAFGLVKCDTDQVPPECDEVQIAYRGANGNAETLSLDSAAAAGALRGWLLDSVGTGKKLSHLGDRKIGLGPGNINGLTAAQISALQVARIWPPSDPGKTSKCHVD